MPPIMSAAEARAQATFTALLWAFSHPGRSRELPDADAFAAIAECLLDLETSFFCADTDLRRRLLLYGARPAAPEAAQYHFYPTLRQSQLELLRSAPAGSYLYPDDGATVVLGCELGSGQRLAWSGPGIHGREELSVGGVPAALWSLRDEALRYPRGWDVVLVYGTRIVGLPRTTAVEVL